MRSGLSEWTTLIFFKWLLKLIHWESTGDEMPDSTRCRMWIGRNRQGLGCAGRLYRNSCQNQGRQAVTLHWAVGEGRKGVSKGGLGRERERREREREEASVRSLQTEEERSVTRPRLLLLAR